MTDKSGSVGKGRPRAGRYWRATQVDNYQCFHDLFFCSTSSTRFCQFGGQESNLMFAIRDSRHADKNDRKSSQGSLAIPEVGSDQ